MTSKLRSIVALLLLCLGVQTASAEEIPGSGFGYGNWSGAGYTYNDTGTFSHCVVSAAYASGDTLFLSVTDGATVVIGISNPAFRFEPGFSFPGIVEIDRRARFAARITAGDGDFVKLEIDRFEEAVQAIQRGLIMRITSDRVRGEYSLKGTMRALDGAIQCAVKNLDYVAKRPSTNQTQTAQRDDSVLYRFTTEVITTLGALDFRYLSEAEMQDLDLSGGVYWVSQELGVVGGVLTTSAPNGSLRVTDGDDIAYLNSFCSGDFASTTRDLTKGGIEQREISGFCVEGADRTQISAIKTRWGPEVIYALLIYLAGSPSDPEVRDRNNTEIALRAARFVGSL